MNNIDTLNIELDKHSIRIIANYHGDQDLIQLTTNILTVDCMLFVAKLHRSFERERQSLLNERIIKQSDIESTANGYILRQSSETSHIRSNSEWRIKSIPSILRDRRCDIVCLDVTNKHALQECVKSGANGVQVDFDDGYAPTWRNNLVAQSNIIETAKECHSPQDALLIMRPRSLNLDEYHILVDGQPISGTLFDYAIFMYHNAKLLSSQGRGPFFYIPKLENHRESIWWNKVISFSEHELGIAHGTTKVIVLIENILATFEMEEIIYYLSDYIVALNTGRWDYIFSFIKKFANSKEHILPDRTHLGLEKDFLQSYYKLLVDTCHKRGCLATGGMAPQYPKSGILSKHEQEALVNGKATEARMGFDGALVAHHSAVSFCKNQFNLNNNSSKSLTKEEIQKEFKRVVVVPKGEISIDQVKASIYIFVNYISSWLKGVGALPLNGIVEDLATAEINRALLWKWLRFKVTTKEGIPINYDFVNKMINQFLSTMQLSPKEVEDMERITSILLYSKQFIDFMPTLLYPIITTIRINNSKL